MKAVVKEFIEATVDLIETEEYHEMFTLWYLYYVEENKAKDYENLTELFNVFEKSGISLYEDSEAARKEILAEHMYEYIYDILDNDPTAMNVTFLDVLKHLNSDLSVSLSERNKIFKQVGQHISGSYDVRLEPFKIVRN